MTSSYRFASLALLASLLPVRAQAAPADLAARDAAIVADAVLVAEGESIALYGHGVTPDAAFLDTAERALERMEALLGRGLDSATLGERVRIYVSADTTVSHVWLGYDHPRDPQGALFVNPKIAHLGVAGRNATYAHELAHLLTWRYASHTLREGLADWLALAVHPGAGVGPNPDADASPAPVPDEVAALLGTDAPPPDALSSDPAFRAAYYAASRRFVAHLVERAGIATFLELYDAGEPEALYQRLYGASREALVREALAGA